MNRKRYAVAVVGASGLVGRTVLRVLEERRFPVARLKLLASFRSAGTTLVWNKKSHPVEELTQSSFEGVQIALFSAGASVSRSFAPLAVTAGAVVIDNSSAFRMDKEVPLVVPEVNGERIPHGKGIISNPNCSTIQMVVALKPLHDRWKIRRIVVSTYQSVTGAGKRGLDQLESELGKGSSQERKFPHPIAYNVLPHIDEMFEDGSSREETKMINETKKIMGDDSIRVTATCVRVPVVGGHSESVNVEFEKPFTLAEVREALRRAPGICLQDDSLRSIYPMPILARDRDDVFVGRIRKDPTVDHGLNLWIVSDNLRKGAATNAVQIAEEWVRRQAKNAR